MFIRTKLSGGYTYLQIVENQWRNGAVRQRMIASLGRLDRLVESGALDRLLQSGCRLSRRLVTLAAQSEDGSDAGVEVRRIGPALVFERLWRETGCRDAVRAALRGRRHRFDVERAVFLSVLHRIMVSGSDRSAMAWRRGQAVAGSGELELQHLYRAMAWLGEALADSEQAHQTRAPRCVKDGIEEDLFDRRKDLFSGLELVFFDTTSLFFFGEGGATLGRRGHSKDRRPDCKQMILGMALDGDGVPVCSEIWPGSIADVTALEQVANRLQHRFGVGTVCLVADRGMISAATLAAIEARGWQYILGARPRASKEVRERVLADPAPFASIRVPRQHDSQPLELGVKEVRISDGGEGENRPAGHASADPRFRRYVVCRNPVEARRDAALRQQMVAELEKKLASDGARSLLGNRGYRRYLVAKGAGFVLDRARIRDEAKFDGIWVLRTNAAMDAAGAALKYKQLWRVEQVFRTAKSLLDTRPIFHTVDETIRGHVFCSFLALVLQNELFRRLRSDGESFEWKQILRDLDALTETVVEQDGKRFLLRSRAQGCCGKVARSVGVRLPAAIRRDDTETPDTETPDTEAAMN